ncbi:hypothetical protein PR048_016054 [Dryococelus australis]|uniref:Uncharacterized protein n=1 Tax=Dryococelus australis TaxID=614101 RepID=A0ABQ9HIX7_9NEOP|nr:hypothetical protein PR048_016054 [Dryococelus australis]
MASIAQDATSPKTGPACTLDNSGLSWNGRLNTGQKIQTDVVYVLLCFKFQYLTFTGDIMQTICDFWINSVIYEVSVAPYLVIQVLQQLATNERSFPNGNCSAHKVLINLANAGGFNLQNIASNEPGLLSWLPSEIIQTNAPCTLGNDDGLLLSRHWGGSRHFLIYCPVSLPSLPNRVSYSVGSCSDIGPLGWLSPIYLWTLGWDDTPPSEVLRTWEQFQSDDFQLSPPWRSLDLFEPKEK